MGEVHFCVILNRGGGPEPEGHADLFAHLNKGMHFFIIDRTAAINHFINNIDIEQILDTDLIRIDPDGFTVSFPYHKGIGNDHQNAESPFLMFENGIDEGIGCIIGIYNYIADVMTIGPEIFEDLVSQQTEAVKGKQIDNGKGNNDIMAEGCKAENMFIKEQQCKADGIEIHEINKD